MKAGFIFECQKGGPDEQIYIQVALDICSSLNILPENISTLGSKRAVFNDCAEDVKVMLDSGCNYVFIIWDRMPKWGGVGDCEAEKQELTQHLTSVGIDISKVILCCIDEMLESWLIADGRGVTNYFKKFDSRSRKFRDHKKQAEQSSPKERLKLFNARYNEYNDNFGILMELKKDYSRAAKWNASFGHFVSAIEQICLS